jgi:hypothetical protein
LYTILIPIETTLSFLRFLEMNPSLPSQLAGKAHVVSGVIHGLLQGRWRGGERLTEEAVAQMFSVSRTPVREGLLELASIMERQPISPDTLRAIATELSRYP